jgi:acetyl-CoA decarbonylase/synthase complex subunit gamma
MTGLQIFKLLPNTNCKECGYPTCLAFAMKLAAGKEALQKCPHASEEAKAALGAASAPPIRGVKLGVGDRAIAIGEETVFFRHEKTFVHHPGLVRRLDPTTLSDAQLGERLDDWAAVRIERAGEVFRVDGVALVEPADRSRGVAAAAAVAARGLPLVVLAASVDGAAAMVEAGKAQRPVLVPPASGRTDGAYVKLAVSAKIPLVVTAPDLDGLVAVAVEAAGAGVAELLLEPQAADLAALHRDLSQIRRGALDRVHPGLAHPVFLRVGPGELERAVVGVTKFASLVAIADDGGDTWLPLWTLRQNIYTDPQKPLQIEPGVHALGEPDDRSPLLVTTNFSLTYFIVATEAEGTGVPCHLAVVNAEGLSVLTAWAAGKLSGDRVAQGLRELGALDKVSHRTVIIPGYVAAISGELEDALGAGWHVITGPQEASDLGAFFRDVWSQVSQA